LRLAGAIALVNPDWFLTLTLVTAPQKEMERLAKALRRRGPMEWAWHVEHNPSGSGLHVHAWLHSSPLTAVGIRDLATKARGGLITFVRKAASLPKTYGFKELLWADESVATRYLEVNGGTVHSSQGFWRDESGKRLAGREAAMVHAARVAWERARL
jgi:hypothetical protein